MPYHVYDSDGRVTLILKKTETAARRAWEQMQQENLKDFGLPIRTIVRIVKVGK